MMKRSALAGLLVTAAACVSAGARADPEQTFSGAKSVSIQDFIGAVEVGVGGDAVKITVTDGAKTYPVTVDNTNDAVVIAGKKRPRNFHWQHDVNWRRNGDEAFRIFLEDYPKLTITAPAGVDIAFDDAIVMAAVGDLHSDAVVKRGYVEATFGAMRNADISISGSGDIAMGAIEHALSVGIGGSGDFEALSAQTATFAIGGSGDITVGPIAEDASVTIGGSGDVNIASVDGAFEAMIGGSGDVFAGVVGKGASLTIAGSGDILLTSVNGPTDVSIAGNGDIGVKSGRAENLRVQIAGSGDFTFGGVSTNLDVSIYGSGGVTVAKNEGNLRRTGRGGDVVVDGKRIERQR